MKRLIATLLLVSLATAFVGCGPETNTATVPDNPVPMPPEAQPVTADGPGAGAPPAAPATP